MKKVKRNGKHKKECLMKKILFLALTALFAFTACNKIDNPEEQQLSLNLTVNYVDDNGTKATKHGWENGDQILVFFNQETTTDCERLLLSYDGNKWSASWLPNTLQSKIAATASGTFSAFYVPYLGMSAFGCPSAGSNYSIGVFDFSGSPTEEFKAAHRIFSYYMAHEHGSYSVTGGTLNMSLNMAVPEREHFAHFFINESDGWPRRFILTESSLGSVSLTGYDRANDKFTTTAETNNQIYGYPYHGGYSFTCFIPAAIRGVTRDFTFVLTDTNNTLDNTADDKHYSLTVTDKSLSRGKAIELPNLASKRWTSLD